MHGDGSFQVVDTGLFVRDPNPYVLAPRFPGGLVEPIRASEFAVLQAGDAALPDVEARGAWTRLRLEPELNH
eukprot:8178623-Alexandrium_andersonii.AAC.1